MIAVTVAGCRLFAELVLTDGVALAPIDWFFFWAFFGPLTVAACLYVALSSFLSVGTLVVWGIWRRPKFRLLAARRWKSVLSVAAVLSVVSFFLVVLPPDKRDAQCEPADTALNGRSVFAYVVDQVESVATSPLTLGIIGPMELLLWVQRRRERKSANRERDQPDGG